LFSLLDSSASIHSTETATIMAIVYRGGVAILQISVFAPALLLALFCIRHGFAKSSDWVLFITFALLRLVGASCQLAAIMNPSIGIVIVARICPSIGLSPLTLLCLGLLTRVFASLSYKFQTKSRYRNAFFHVQSRIRPLESSASPVWLESA
jgi:hypothetical protein